jgi:hypothetical protein
MEALRSSKTISLKLEVNEKLITYFRALTLEIQNKIADNSEAYVSCFLRTKLETNSEGSRSMKERNLCLATVCTLDMQNVYEFLSNTLHLQCKWLLCVFSSNERAWNGKWTKGLCFLEGQQSPGRNKAKFVVLLLETVILHKRISTWRVRRILKAMLVLYTR